MSTIRQFKVVDGEELFHLGNEYHSKEIFIVSMAITYTKLSFAREELFHIYTELLFVYFTDL